MEKNAGKLTLSERIYDQIRRDIITNQLKPGEKINIRELCERYDASETPIRLALNRLASENIIDNFPRQGMRVKNMDVDLCEETFDARMMLECYYLSNVVMTLNVNETMRNAFRQNVEHNLQAVELLDEGSSLDDYLTNYRYDIEFHELLIKATGNKLLLDLYRFLNPFLYVNYVYSKQSKARLLTGILEHKAILQALLDGDAEKAKQALVHHLTNSKQVITSLLKIDSIL